MRPRFSPRNRQSASIRARWSVNPSPLAVCFSVETRAFPIAASNLDCSAPHASSRSARGPRTAANASHQPVPWLHHEGAFERATQGRSFFGCFCGGPRRARPATSDAHLQQPAARLSAADESSYTNALQSSAGVGDILWCARFLSRNDPPVAHAADGQDRRPTGFPP